MTLLWRTSLAAVWPTQIALAGIVAWLRCDQVNPDTIVYIRIAQYYLSGQTDLLISGYWGPMLSWLIVPWLLIFADPLLAAHAAMAVSAVVFLVGGFCVLRAARLPDSASVIGMWIIALIGVAWSINPTPDLLMAGLLCCGTSQLVSDKWVANVRTALGAGLVLGASYLAKAVALPVSALMLIGLASTNVVVYQSSLRQAVRAAAMTIAGFLIVAGPWIGILSYKYGHPVFSTSGSINHAIAGPRDMERFHPTFRTFHKPETRRLTSWEDPTGMPYQHWSPLENISYAVHQAKVIYGNALLLVQYLQSFDWLGLGLVCAIFGFLFGTPWKKSLQEEMWRWLLIPIFALCVIYLPVLASAPRYFFVALPFLLAVSLGYTLSLAGSIFQNNQVKHALALTLVTLSFVMGNKDSFRKAFDPSNANGDYLAAKILADKLKMTGLIGPIASVGSAWGSGLYLAYLLNTQWFGHRVEVNNPEEILSSGADLIILPRGTAMAKQLREDPRFTSADRQLFGCKGVIRETFEVYLTRSRTTHDTCPESSLEHKISSPVY